MTIGQDEWQLEAARLMNVREQIERKIEELDATVDIRRGDAETIRLNFWNDISVNVENEDDLIETAASITQQAHVLSGQERSYKLAYDALRKLEQIVDTPYFSRIDFVEAGSSLEEQIYIGLASFLDPVTDEILIYDWRAPISNLFYDFPPGPASYTTPEMTIEGELKLKRQYMIKSGQLLNMFDTGISIGDEMLQQMLSRNADDKMHSIVTTIQREQNLIIRDDKHKVLIVQGAAGSGKTSVALQRIAYLLYKYRKTLSADQMILFSPNSLFSDYVSSVLPELGETNMQQTTLQDYLSYRLAGAELMVEDSYDQLEFVLSADTVLQPEDAARLEGIRYKGSAAFLQVIEAYGARLRQEGIRFSSFSVGAKVLISSEQISGFFYEKQTTMSLGDRMENMKEWITGRLDEIQLEAEKRIYRKLSKEPKYIGADQELKRMSRQKAQRALGPLKEKAEKLQFIDVPGLYRQLFESSELYASLAREVRQELPEAWEAIKQYTSSKLKQGHIMFEDATPLVYLKGIIEGQQTVNTIRYAIVDEAQDYSPFHYAYLRKLFPRARFTLLGDWNQGIYAHASQEGAYSSIGELMAEETETVRLVKSYRSTREIVEFASRILPHGEPVEPFNRSGEEPRLERASDEQDLTRRVVASVKAWADQGIHSMAIICKTKQETRRAHELLVGHLPHLQLITKETLHFAAGVMILPAYLAKGLEFDAVLIYNAGRQVYAEERERKLFYTACTRALHQLQLCYVGEPSPFIM
ncbi:RNA polymerase recycling motor HelD [Paenibacillus eucommiae]|uniref:DNA helicase-2/ATP-dependent DNA helicase PcrA n=1 Tax=Paenibacillus eucommiae TaxID=1355755 RepID=A0ABS4IZY1_9BACL|nr:RNA polymerase recycling motor HelD [Paenibacillus eucommiae]MBP1992411.1 DNA helicase-2/ATP-dependent DNA helicase PcrA [Paenibacillus eucommiae]